MPTLQDCPADALAEAGDLARDNPEAGLARARALAAQHPGDARLRFLEGSLLAGLRRYDEAGAALREAVVLAPDFGLARFQLGLLELTNGRGPEALAILAPLRGLPALNPLRAFAEGLDALIADRFEEAVERLETGLRLGVGNEPLEADMRMLVDAIRARTGEPAEPAITSSAQLLLKQFGAKTTRH